MLLARVYSETGRIKEAARTFNEAIDVVESDDHYLETEKLRVKFDDERRELYDSAIDFEYNHGSPDSAWTYLQKYRAKLFLEFLAQFNSNIDRVRSEAFNRSRVQKLVPADTQIIEYALLKDRLLIWLISDRIFTSRSIRVARTQVEGKVQEVLQKLRNDQNADQLLEELGGLLIDPVADLLDPNRTIAIIPDRALHGLPFPALRRPGDRKYLIQNFPILISPSLTHLLATDASRPQRGSIVGFGSQFDDSSEMKELLALKTIYRNSTTFAGANVDKARFLTAMNTAPIVHYAGHSATDAVDPLRSSILLDGNRYGPNSVTAVDISQQRLWKNAVVVLSSCDSSVGNSRDGVGMRGLTSAFLIGGAGSVVGSLWPVEASSTSELMIAFHRAFASEQLPVAKALRQAQLAFIESSPERSHPYYWSGFVVTGNFSALR
jgi:CHAT domain-containing protein